MLIFFKSQHYSFFEKLKIVEKQLCKVNCSNGKVSHTLKTLKLHVFEVLHVQVKEILI